MSTLMDFRYKRKYEAGNGADGQGPEDRQGRHRSGHQGSTGHAGAGRRDRRDHAGHVWRRALCSLQRRSGRLGQQPLRHSHPAGAPLCQGGLPGEAHDVILELKLLADVGLVGFPNVGKSTPLSVVSRPSPRSPTTTSPPCSPIWAWCG